MSPPFTNNDVNTVPSNPHTALTPYTWGKASTLNQTDMPRTNYPHRTITVRTYTEKTRMQKLRINPPSGVWGSRMFKKLHCNPTKRISQHHYLPRATQPTTSDQYFCYFNGTKQFRSGSVIVQPMLQGDNASPLLPPTPPRHTTVPTLPVRTLP